MERMNTRWMTWFPTIRLPTPWRSPKGGGATATSSAGAGAGWLPGQPPMPGSPAIPGHRLRLRAGIGRASTSSPESAHHDGAGAGSSSCVVRGLAARRTKS